MRKLTDSLRKAKRFDHIIAVIEAALETGQSQPWMYDVLALSMKIENRPAEDIERVLLSRVDFSTTDVHSLLYSAAMLMQFEAPEQALALYRQASKIEPTRPEPYVLGLNPARALRDYDAVEWAAAGIVTHAWTDDREVRHQTARDAVADSQRELREAGNVARADQLAVAFKEALRRDLEIRVEWSGNGDLDLSVEEPFGTECSVQNPVSAGGGVLVHDGYGPDAANTYDEYVCVRGGKGDYRAQITFVSGDIVGKRCQLIITRYKGSPEEQVRRLDVPLDKTTKIIRLTLHEGRRDEPDAARVQPADDAMSQRLTRQQIMAQLPRADFRRNVVAGGNATGPVIGQPQGNGIQLAGGAVLGQLGGGGGAGQGGIAVPVGGLGGGVAYQPVVGFIAEGVSLSATALVSPDRRYVRLSVAPFFNVLQEIQTFTFQR